MVCDKTKQKINTPLCRRQLFAFVQRNTEELAMGLRTKLKSGEIFQT